MEKETVSLRQWLINCDKGMYESTDIDTQIAAGWYDWFCTDKSLSKRLAAMVPKIRRICTSKKVDLDNSYIFFKNNCPCVGEIYDDFRICDIKTGDVIYTITPKSGHAPGNAEVYGRENKFDGPLANGTWKDVLNYFNV
jgi:hypothetical protein